MPFINHAVHLQQPDRSRSRGCPRAGSASIVIREATANPEYIIAITSEIHKIAGIQRPNLHLRKLLPATGVIWALRAQRWKKSPKMSSWGLSAPGPRKFGILVREVFGNPDISDSFDICDIFDIFKSRRRLDLWTPGIFDIVDIFDIFDIFERFWMARQDCYTPTQNSIVFKNIKNSGNFDIFERFEFSAGVQSGRAIQNLSKLSKISKYRK